VVVVLTRLEARALLEVDRPNLWSADNKLRDALAQQAEGSE
jgi:hypothetical protein